MTNKKQLQIVNMHLKDARKELKIAKESLGMGYSARFRKMRKDTFEEFEVLVFCLEKGKEFILKSQ